MSRALAILLTVATVALLAGCGSGGSTTGSSSPAARQAAVETATKETAKIAQEGEAQAPKGASPTLKGVYRSFQKPKTKAMEPEAADAVEAGEAACEGKTPIEVKEQFYAEAKKYLEPQQAKMIGQIPQFEAKERSDQAFVAGQLGADVYAATLEEEDEQGGYQGCVYALAQALEQRLAPKEKK